MQLCEGPLTSRQWPVPGKLEGRSGSIADVASESALCDVPHISNRGSSEPLTAQQGKHARCAMS